MGGEEAGSNPAAGTSSTDPTTGVITMRTERTAVLVDVVTRDAHGRERTYRCVDRPTAVAVLRSVRPRGEKLHTARTVFERPVFERFLF
jgi:hypothetical protein